MVWAPHKWPLGNVRPCLLRRSVSALFEPFAWGHLLAAILFTVASKINTELTPTELKSVTVFVLQIHQILYL